MKGGTLDYASAPPVRYAVRQVLDQEYHKETIRKISEASQSKYSQSRRESNGKIAEPDGNGNKDSISTKPPRDNPGVKRDFFGRIINETVPPATKKPGESHGKLETQRTDRTVWVTFHEGFSNAVRKPISMNELLAEL
jgi:chromosome transmission fidelity protein 18